jgi:hypothetical protein
MPTVLGQRLKRAVARLALVAASLAVCGAAVELIVRLLWKPYVFHIDRRHYEPEPWPFSFRLLPREHVFLSMPEMAGGGFDVDLNRHGFRGPDLDEAAQKRLRVVSIGDSFTFGWGLANFEDQCVVGFAAEYARQRPRADLGLTVVAEPGWGVRDYLFAYLRFARPLRPPLVIVGFFCGDDLASPGTIASIGEGPPPGKPWAQSRSAFRLASLNWARACVRGSPTLTKLALSLGIRPASELMRFARADSPLMAAMWDETLKLLGALNTEVRRDGARLVILSYPSLIQVVGHRQLDDKRFDYRLIDRKLAAFCQSEGIVFIPFLPALVADGQLDLFYGRDRHLTPRGQGICRDVLLRELTPVLDEIEAGTRP